MIILFPTGAHSIFLTDSNSFPNLKGFIEHKNIRFYKNIALREAYDWIH